MGRKKGLFAELQRASAQAQRQRQRANAAAYRAQQQASREAERTAREAERYAAQAARADAKAAIAAEKEAKRLYVEAREAEVASMNEDLIVAMDDLDNILHATLEVDDHVDLELLRQVAQHPEFESPFLTPIPKPETLVGSAEPVFIEPEPPRGLSGLFGKKKHQEAIEAARVQFDAELDAWKIEMASLPMRQLEQLAEYKKQEALREEKLAADRSKYDEECSRREQEVSEQNRALDGLINGLQNGRQEAVEEYVGIVFGNTVYPQGMEPDYEYQYDSAGKELTVSVELPHPNDFPAVASYKYVKASDEVTEKPLSAKDRKDRFNMYVVNSSLRTIHEIFEADRLGNILSISLSAGVTGVVPATGQIGTTPLLACAVSRDTFEGLDLSKVIPSETLKHLNAVVSKNAFGLEPINTSRGVRAH